MIKKSLITFFVLAVLIQFIPIDKTNPKVDESLALHTDEDVMRVLKKSCYDCHSNETKWSVYADIAPLSFGVSMHVKDGRKALNFSNWKNIPADIKEARLKRFPNVLKLDMMPPSSYTMLHSDKKLSKGEKLLLVKWSKAELGEVVE